MVVLVHINTQLLGMKINAYMIRFPQWLKDD
jgi:hypothetical protein